MMNKEQKIIKWQVREWVGKMQRVVADDLTLEEAFSVRKKLKEENPHKDYSIYRSLKRRRKVNEYQIKTFKN